MEIEEIKRRLAKRKQEVLEKRVKNNLLLSQISDLETRLESRKQKIETIREAHDFVEKVASGRRTDMKDKIQLVVTEALKIIYGPEYELILNYSSKANRSCLDIEVKKSTKDGDVIRDMSGFGGGVSDTISVPMRIAIICGAGQDRIMVLDEAFKHVDDDRMEFVGEFLKSISLKMGMQIILLSQHQKLINSVDHGILLYPKTDGVGVKTLKSNTK